MQTHKHEEWVQQSARIYQYSSSFIHNVSITTWALWKLMLVQQQNFREIWIFKGTPYQNLVFLSFFL